MTIYGHTLTKEPAKGHEINKFRQRLAYRYHVLEPHGHNLAQEPPAQWVMKFSILAEVPLLIVTKHLFFPKYAQKNIFKEVMSFLSFDNTVTRDEQGYL